MRPLLVEGEETITREACLSALGSEVLRAVAEIAVREGPTAETVIEQVQVGSMPALWGSMVRRCEEARVPDPAVNLARYLLLDALVNRYLSQVRLLPAPQDVQHYMYDEFQFIAKPTANSLYCFEPGSSAFRSLCRIVCLKRFAAGQLQFEPGGIPRSYLWRVPRKSALPLLGHMLFRLRGRRPLYTPHNAPRRKFSAMFLEREQRRSMVRIAEMIEMNPSILGFMGEGWLHSENLGEASPHLSWMMEINRELEEYGGFYTHIGAAPEDVGYLTGDRRRIEMYKAGVWRPTHGLVIVPRDGMIAWAQAQIRRL